MLRAIAHQSAYAVSVILIEFVDFVVMLVYKINKMRRPGLYKRRGIEGQSLA